MFKNREAPLKKSQVIVLLYIPDIKLFLQMNYY